MRNSCRMRQEFFLCRPHWTCMLYFVERVSRRRGSMRHSPFVMFILTLFLTVGIGTALLAVLSMEISMGNDSVQETSVSRFGEPIPVSAAAEAETEEPAEEISSFPDAVKVSSSGDGGTVTFDFAGDILFDPSYMAGDAVIGRGIRNCFDAEVLAQMEGADIFMLNNEFAYTDRGEPLEGKQYTLHAPTYTAPYLFDIGTDLVSLGNNHVYDYGETGLLDTLDTLDAIGMPYVGAGRNIEEASRPAIYDLGGMTVGIVCGTQIERFAVADTKGATETSAGVFRCYDMTPMYEKVKELDSQVDFVIVYIHWGDEKKQWPVPAQTEAAQGLAESGADLIIGDHPHVLQTIGYVEGVPVVYSLGNYLFNTNTQDTGIVEAVFDPVGKTLSSLRFIPMEQENLTVRMLSGEEKERCLSDLRELSPDALIDENGVISAP